MDAPSNAEADSKLPKTFVNSEIQASANVDLDLGTSVWNNHTVPKVSEAMVEEKQQNHIPSPIARPTKTQRASASTPPKAVMAPPSAAVANSGTVEGTSSKDDFSTTFSSSASASTTSACYEFAYEQPLKTASPIGVKASPKSTPEVRKQSTEGPSLDQILHSDHVQLKEKLDKVKDFWPGQSEFEQAALESAVDKTSLSQAHGPNVAKVKPQPQNHHEQHSQHQQPQQQQQTYVPQEIKGKPIEAYGVFTLPPSQSPNLYQRGNAVFTMGLTSPFRQISSNQVLTFGNNDYVQHYGGHASSPPNHSYFGGQINLGQAQPSRPQSYDGMLNQLWNNGTDYLSTVNPAQPMQSQPSGQGMQTRYISTSRPPSHPSANVNQPAAFHLPPPPTHLGYQQGQQQPIQLTQNLPPLSNNYIPTHMPPPSMPTYIEFMSGPPPAGPTRNGNARSNPQPHQQVNQHYLIPGIFH